MTEQGFIGGIEQDIEEVVHDIGRLLKPTPVHIASQALSIGEKLAPDFGACMTWTIPLLGTNTALAILQRRPSRDKARLYWNAAAAGFTFTGNTGAFTAAGGSAALSLYTGVQYLTGFTITAGLAIAGYTGPTTVTVSNVVGGPYTYELQESTTSGSTLQITYPGNGLPGTGGDPTVTVAASTDGASGTINVYGNNQTPLGGNGIIYLNSKADPLNVSAAQTPQGLIMPPGTWVTWDSQQPCYAICAGSSAQQIVTLDQAYAESSTLPK